MKEIHIGNRTFNYEIVNLDQPRFPKLTQAVVVHGECGPDVFAEIVLREKLSIYNTDFVKKSLRK